MIHLIGGAGDGGNRAVITQNLVAYGIAIGDGVPRQRVLVILEIHLQVLRRSRRGHVTLFKTCKTHGVLGAVNPQGVMDIATDPQGAGGIHKGFPNAEAVVTLNRGGKFG